ncbi:MAG TPA: methyltransferase [Kofleriaceae bacterium]|jgi:tRNA1(Val) A37 N6-methylase TrmN6|nr:methyltransferase [Kofleriaceae bacterium]
MTGERGIVRVARRPPGWRAPGPSPAGPQGRAELEPAAGEDLCYLAGDWRVFQKLRGHRWSLDDLVTAWIATRGLDPASCRRALDLGCGLGSVLLMVAWSFPDAEVLGIEAQADRAALGRRSISYNGVDARCRIVDGDLRHDTPAGPFDLVTGTPPYFPRGTGTESDKPHAAPARFEHRGGVEDYLAIAADRVAPGGRITLCSSVRERARVDAAVRALGLGHHERWAIVPRADKDPLVLVDVLARPGARAPAPHQLVVRDRDGRWTPEFQRVRGDLGMPTMPPNYPSPLSSAGQ